MINKDLEKLNNQMEMLRQSLHEAISNSNNSLESKELILNLSRKLDKLIVAYMKKNV